MPTISCPWCEGPGALELAAFLEPELSFDCPECGTRIEFVDEPAEDLEMAA